MNPWSNDETTLRVYNYRHGHANREDKLEEAHVHEDEWALVGDHGTSIGREGHDFKLVAEEGTFEPGFKFKAFNDHKNLIHPY